MKRIFKIVSIFVLSSSILIGLVLLSLQSSWLQNRLVQAGLDSIDQSIAGHLSIARFDGSLLGKLTLHQLELTFQNQPVISIDQVQLNFSLIRLLRRQICIQAVTIQRPQCRFEIQKGQWNLISALTAVSPAPSETDTTAKTAFKWQIRVKNLNLTDARLTINRDSHGLNWQSISIQNLFLASEGGFRDSIAWINIHEFKFSAINPALNLKALTARIEYSPTSLKIQQFSLDTDSSHFDLNGWVGLRSQSRLQLFCTAQPWHRHDWQLFFPELPFFPSPWISLQANTSADSLHANLELQQAQQSIKLTAACQWPELEKAGYRLAATIRRLNLAEVFHNPALKSLLNAQIHVTGENFQPDQMYLKSQWRMSASVFQQLRIDSTTIQAELQAGRLQLNGSVDFYPGFLHFQGRVDSVFGQPGYRLNLQTEAAPVLSLFGVQALTDRIPVQAQVRGSGFDWQNLAAFFHLKIPGAVIAGVPIDRVDCQAEWQRGRLTISRGTLTSPIADVFLNGWFSADRSLQAEYLIKVKDLTRIPHTWLPDSMNAAGQIQGTAAGTLDSLRLITRLELTDFAWPPYQIKRLQVDFNGDLFSTVKKFQTHGQSCLELSADGLYLTKNSPLESLQLKAQLAAGELYTTAHLVSRPGEQAWLSGKMKSGDTLHCQIDTLALQLDQLTWRNFTPLYLHYVPGGWLQVDQFRLESPQSYLTLQGQLNPTATQNFQCVARNFDLQMVKAWIPDWQYHGLLDTDLQLAGTLAAPFIAAEIRLKKLAYQQLTADSLYCEMQYRDRLAHF
ncbi:hypothetical protein L0128_09430, partial [candidate division KSB1 bacterium]|nr:hypothetical protein [candidate division KSB1 bacterium]